LGLGLSAVCEFREFSLLLVLYFFFFFFFLLPRVWFPLYTSRMLKSALRFFNIFLCLQKKKKKKRKKKKKKKEDFFFNLFIIILMLWESNMFRLFKYAIQMQLRNKGNKIVQKMAILLWEDLCSRESIVWEWA
jgi:hypothetical protein